MGRGAGSSLTSEQRVKRLVTLALPLYLTLLVASVHGFKALGLEIELTESVLKAQRLPWGLNSAELVTAKGVESAHSSATTAFSITAALTYQVWRWSHHPTKRSVALLVFAINFVAAINYGSKLLGLQPPLKAHGVFKSTTGVVVYGPLRYLEWVFTTSFLIRVVGCLTPDGPRAQRLIRSTIFYNVLVITLGAVEHWVCCAAAGAQAFELHRQVAVAIFVVACCHFWCVLVAPTHMRVDTCLAGPGHILTSTF